MVIHQIVLGMHFVDAKMTHLNFSYDLNRFVKKTL